MKKIYFIISGIVAVLILLAIWVYLLIYGTPQPVTAFFTDFSLTGDSTTINDSLLQPIMDPVVDVATAKLRQITLKPVSGFEEVVKNDNERFAYYVEAGTGHIYSINLLSGEEIRLSNITIPNTTEAAISKNGEFAAFRSGLTNSSQKFTIINLSDPTNISTSVLENKIIEFTWNNSGQLLYTTYRGNGLVGQSYDPLQMTIKDIFAVPFPSATVIWNENSNDLHYAYTKTSAKLNGYLYALTNNTMKRLPIEGTGLAALINKNYVVITRQTNNGAPISQAVSLTNDKIIPIVGIVNPNKCVFSETETDIMYCGYSQESYGPDFPDDWYKGTRTFSDVIWRISINQGLASQLINPETTLGRPIDIIHMEIGSGGEVLYFINKNDNTLWMYEI